MTTPPPHNTPNITEYGAYCPHCNNSGLVCLDHLPNHGAPCPMCQKGASCDLGMFRGRYWADIRSLNGHTWEHGASIRHTKRCRFAEPYQQYPCGKPTESTFCEYHSQDVNRVATKSVPSLGEAIRQILSPSTKRLQGNKKP